MEIIKYYILLVLMVYGVSMGRGQVDDLNSSFDVPRFNRTTFPDGFIFGTASSAYQFEGAWNEDGKGQSIWDNFTHSDPGVIIDRSNGDVAVDQYHGYKEDVAIMKKLKIDAYRFSISWTRILPRGTLKGGVNPKGIEHYLKLTQELLDNGIQPFVTIFHWDSPQALEDDYDGFRSPKIVNDFRDYADLCFESFGHLVKNWITLNEPCSFAVAGYANGRFAPGRCSPPPDDFNEKSYGSFIPGIRGVGLQQQKCKGGNSSTEPYIVAHNLLLAHAAAVQVYRQKYQARQKGQIGISLNTEWFEPFDNQSEKDIEAAQRALAFMYGCPQHHQAIRLTPSLQQFMEPLTFGRYPTEMISRVRDRLPEFSPEESKLVKGSYDFIGLNYYTGTFSQNVRCPTSPPYSYFTDPCINTSKRNISGDPIGPQAGSRWLYIYPIGIRKTLLHTINKYKNPTIYVTENGVDRLNGANGLDTTRINDHLNDTIRIDYHRDHLKYVLTILKDIIGMRVNIKGYFVWAFSDNFEWDSGYTVRFGLVNVDKLLNRDLKKSADWFRNFLYPPVY